MDITLRKAICRLVAGLIVADDDVDPREDAFLDRMLAGFGFCASDRDMLFPIVDHGEAAAAIDQLPAEARREALSLLIGAAAADGRIVADERSYLEAVASAMRIAPGELDVAVKRAVAAARAQTGA